MDRGTAAAIASRPVRRLVWLTDISNPLVAAEIVLYAAACGRTVFGTPIRTLEARLLKHEQKRHRM